MIFLIMIFVILGRITSFSLVFSFMKINAVIPLSIVFLLLVIISLTERKIGVQKRFLAIVTSILAPCLILKDDSFHYLINGITGSIASLAITWSIYFLVPLRDNFPLNYVFPNSSTIMECSYKINVTQTMRCAKDMGTSDCLSGIMSFSSAGMETICPLDYGKWYYLQIVCIAVTVLLLVNVAAIILLHKLIDPVFRMRFAKKLGMTIWPPRDMFWLKFVNQLLDKEDFDSCNNSAIAETGKSLLELSIQSRLFGFTKVCITM